MYLTPWKGRCKPRTDIRVAFPKIDGVQYARVLIGSTKGKLFGLDCNSRLGIEVIQDTNTWVLKLDPYGYKINKQGNLYLLLFRWNGAVPYVVPRAVKAIKTAEGIQFKLLEVESNV